MTKFKKILITGTLGYIGSVLKPYLEERGYECIGYDTGFFKDCLMFGEHDDSVIMGDMRQFDETLLDGISGVIHLAGISNDPFGDLMPEAVYDSSRDYSLWLAERCKHRGIKFVFASSCSIYGKGLEDVVSEESPINPQTPYSVNKVEIEEGLKALAGDGFTPICLRFATLFGLSPRMRFDIVVNMLTGMAITDKRIVLNSDGQAWRPYVHMQDVCESFRRGVEFDTYLNEALIVNIGDSSQNFKIIQVAEIVKSMVPGCEIVFLNHNRQFNEEEELIRDRKVQDGVDTRTYQVSFEKAKQFFEDFECQWTVEKGIRQMIDKFQEIQLTKEEFQNIRYYRLQTMENLYQTQKINQQLFWN